MSRTERPGRLLLVDGDPTNRLAMERVLSRRWEVQSAPDAKTALKVFSEVDPAVVISNFRIPGMNGAALFAKLGKLAPNAQRILVAAPADEEAIDKAIRSSGSLRFVGQPWTEKQLLLTVQGAFEQHEELRTLNLALEGRVEQRTQLLATAKREWEKTFDSIDSPLAVVRGEDQVVMRANKAYARVAGRPVQQVGAHPRCHTYLFGQKAPCEGCPLPSALADNAEKHAEINQGGKTYVLSIYPMSEEGYAVCTYRDVTQERQLTRRMMETEKMAAVGQLAGGVAHEINNPLGGMLAFAQLMKRDPGRSPQDLESLGLIEESALRCKRIVESLIRFSRRNRQEERSQLDLSACVDDAVSLFRAQLKTAPRAKLELTLAAGLPQVHGVPAQLGQVVLNLLQNGLQAMPKQEGTLTVETGQRGDRCFVRVTDTGVGIAAEHVPHIFEPSFTTKPPGEGTGLGLAIAYRIVEDHGGEFHVDTELGKGTSLTVLLPAKGTP